MTSCVASESTLTCPPARLTRNRWIAPAGTASKMPPPPNRQCLRHCSGVELIWQVATPGSGGKNGTNAMKPRRRLASTTSHKRRRENHG